MNKNRKKRKLIIAAAVSVSIAAALAGCGTAQNNSTPEPVSASQTAEAQVLPQATSPAAKVAEIIMTSANVTSNGALDATDFFTDRDLQQSADLTDAVSYTVKDGETIRITTEGVYVISGTAANAQILVEAADTDKVQLVLDGVSITNDSIPCIYVKSADKVFVTTTDSENSLSVTGTFSADGDTNTDAAIFSKDDLVLNGTGTLKISSSDNAVSSKDDLKVTGGTYEISCGGTALEANDSIVIADGTFRFTSCYDGLHAENDEDNTLGYIYICGGSFEINASDDGIHGTTTVQIDDGSFTISAAEGIEGTIVQINGGTIYIEASDDGINAAYKSAYSPYIEFNGGETTVVMGAGDTDGVDSNGDIYVNGGTINVSGQSAFDYDGTAQKTGGTIIVNGTETDTIQNQMMGGGMGGPGGMGGFGGPGR